VSQYPRTPEEWQEAVDAAAAFRGIADCMMYGLLEGGPRIDVARSDDLLKRGRRRGAHPSRPAKDLAVDYVRAYNDSLKNKTAPPA
jgi:hypothetical protein